VGGTAQRTGRILVVDDDPELRRMLTFALADEGYDVRGVPNGRAALELLEGWLPNVIVLDLMMPDLDGWAFRTEQLATPAVADVPVIVLTAARDVQAQVLGSVAIVLKPFNLEQLLETVTDVVGSR
jgi:DNA-binding response OmpR family regulator